MAGFRPDGMFSMLATETATSFSWSRKNGLATLWRSSGEVRRASNRANTLAFPESGAAVAAGMIDVLPASMT